MPLARGAPWMRNLEPEKKKDQEWGVFVWMDQSGTPRPNEGYVTRPRDVGGSFQQHYRDATPVKIFKRESSAEQYAEKLNKERH